MPNKFTQGDKPWDTTLDSPADNAEAIIPHASTNMTNFCRAIYVGVAGNVEVVTINDQVVIFVGAVAGSIIPIQAKRVNAAGTSATNLIALW